MLTRNDNSEPEENKNLTISSDIMNNFLLNGTVLFIGIGGISMSAIAEHLYDRGAAIKGYDAHRSDVTLGLEAKGINISYSYSPELFDGVSLCVFTNAISGSDPMYMYPHTHGIKCVTRAQILGAIMLEKPVRIGISGTHGKSSTTAMISRIFIENKSDPSVFIGAYYDAVGGTHRWGSGDPFIFEACEYKDSFLDFYPTVSVILNTELDHVDYFGNIDRVIESFSKFASIPGPAGFTVYNADSENTVKAVSGCSSKAVAFSIKDPSAAYFASDIADKNGFYSFMLVADKKELTRISLAAPGSVLVTDALAAAACAHICGITPDVIAAGLGAYTGIKRRFEYRGRTKYGAAVYDDYAHHPDEIRAALAIAKEMRAKNITTVFQPHTYTRTKALFDGFRSAFSDCEEVIFADIYSAREDPIPGVTAEALALSTPNGKYLGDFSQIAKYLENKSGDTLIMIMGAGDIINLTDMILRENDI